MDLYAELELTAGSERTTIEMASPSLRARWVVSADGQLGLELAGPADSAPSSTRELRLAVRPGLVPGRGLVFWVEYAAGRFSIVGYDDEPAPLVNGRPTVLNDPSEWPDGAIVTWRGLDRVGLVLRRRIALPSDRLTCPRCSERVQPLRILYGYPNPEMSELARRGLVALGGCVIERDAPTFRCPACGAGFRSAEDVLLPSLDEELARVRRNLAREVPAGQLVVTVAEAGAAAEPRRFEFEAEELFIGRGGPSGLVLAGEDVELIHARLVRVRKDGQLHLVDLRSTRGTRVNGRRIEGSVPIRPDDEVAIGRYLLRVCWEGE